MIIFRDYDKENKIDRVWFESTNVIYSECDDNDNDYKTLRVTFKGGATYEYKKVDVNDYMMFISGGLDGSNGKALNQFIKPKCECVKIEAKNLQELSEELERRRAEKEQNSKN